MKRAFAASNRQGVVSHVDAAQGLIRLDLGDGMLSPWIPYVQTAGALKIHSAPSVGQLMSMVSPSGETSQGYAIPLSFGGGNAPPSTDESQHVITFGSVRISLLDTGLIVTVGELEIAISSSGLAVTGGEVTHDGVNIGSTHRHGGVDRGGSSTDGPE